MSARPAAERFTDPANERIILLMAGGMVALAVVLTVGTVWWWRACKVEHPALGPLEVMSSRAWWKGDYTARRRRLDAARPEGAEALAEVAAVDEVDLQALVRSEPAAFDDLLDPAEVARLAEEAKLALAIGEHADEVEVQHAGSALALAEMQPDSEAEPHAALADSASDAHAALADLAPDAGEDETGDLDVDAPSVPIDPLLRLNSAE
ncbi:MAG: hypothetical protein Q7V88_02715 [Actinomycetota bacterium]|nr:hypothetical protein [Actinomycetota bacterium]